MLASVLQSCDCTQCLGVQDRAPPALTLAWPPSVRAPPPQRALLPPCPFPLCRRESLWTRGLLPDPTWYNTAALVRGSGLSPGPHPALCALEGRPHAGQMEVVVRQ